MYSCPQDPMFFYREPGSFIPSSPQRPSFYFDDSILYQRQPYMMSSKAAPFSIPEHTSPPPISSHGPQLKFGMQQILRRPEETSHYQDPSPDVLNSLPVYFRLKPTLRTPSGRRCRKSRTVFTDLQLRVLEKTFSEQKYLDTSNRGKLAQTLGLNETQVKTWFQNRRMKWKKENNKSSITVESPESVENKDKAGNSEDGASALSNGQENSSELAARNPTE